MCGICGIVYLDPGERVDRAVLERMCAVLRHRGPDEEGILLERGAGLAMRRLSIIDRSGGHQPIQNEDDTVAVICNGEIYNFRELQRELVAGGHRLRTKSDAEVIVHLYEDYGCDCVKRLRGMFAFALWDTKQRELLLARDRLGKKPLFYAWLGNRVIFASEIKAILQAPDVPMRVHAPALDAYLRFGYIPAPGTIFEGIHKLLPGHILRLRDAAIRLDAFWKLDFPTRVQAREERDWQGELLEQLREAVRLRLMSEVPLGALLSGGIDSSAVVALMAEASDRPVKTFSIEFAEPKFNETPFARAVAERYGTEHHEYLVEPEGLETLLPELVWHFDEPFGDSSALPTYYVSKLARQAVTVVLTGDGGDEAFAGYTAWQGERLSGLYQRLPGPFRSLASPELVRHLRSLTFGQYSGMLAQAERVLAAARLQPIERFLSKMTKMPLALRRSLYTEEFRAVALPPASDGTPSALRVLDEAIDPINRLACWMTGFYLPNDMLVKVDRMSMAHSLEARCPFLDHVLVEFAARIPPELKLRGLTTKYILKRTLEPLLPKEILWRRKHGFEIPLRMWFRGNLDSWAREVLLSDRFLARRQFHPETVRGLIDDHVGGRADNGTYLWLLLVLETWQRLFVDDELRRLPKRTGAITS